MDARSLVRGSAIAAVLAVVVLFGAILPAEYGIDPTGVGEALGFTKLSETGGVAPANTSTEDEVYSLRADWRLTRTSVAAMEDTARPGETARLVVPVNITNLTRLTATLEWTDDEEVDGEPTLPDRFDLRIVAPDRRDSGFVTGANTPGGAGNLSAEIAWRSVPFPQTGPGDVVFPVLEPDTSAIGEWIVYVRLLEAGGTGADTDDDPGASWRLEVTAESHHLRVTETTGRSGDQVTLTLPPGRAVEYKFQMQTGATMDYAWSASAPVYWDLHAEPTGAAADDTTSFRTGTSTGDTGVHEAPFAGRHGWYWQNRGDAPVEITLETRGDYTILGVV